MATVKTRYLKRSKRSAGHSRTCQRMKRAARQAVVTLFLSPLPCLVQAHDPGLSTATMQLGADKLEAVLVFSVIDVGGLAGLEPARNGPASKAALARAAAELQQKARDALEVWFDDKLAKASEARCRFDENGNATVYLSFPARSFSTLTIRSKWLALLPPGHRQFFSLQNPDGDVLAERLLSAKSDSATLQRGAATLNPD